MTLLLSLLAGTVGAGVAWAAAAALTILIGGFLSVSEFEGGRGMLTVWGIEHRRVGGNPVGADDDHGAV